MVGKILHFDALQGTGIIRGDDGNRYPFLYIEVRNFTGTLAVGAEVDFELDEQMNALEIYILSGNAAPQQQANGMNFMGSCNEMNFKELFSWEGCYSRGQYWKIVFLLAGYSLLLYFIAFITYKQTSYTGFSMVDGVAGTYGRYKHISSIMFWGEFPTMWIGFVATIKRFHDLNKSGAWILINLIPFIGSLVSFIMTGLLSSNHYNNRYCTRVADVKGGEGAAPSVNTMNSNAFVSASPAHDATQSIDNTASSEQSSFTMPSIDVAVIKKYKKQLLIGIPVVIVITVWFFIFRSVTVDKTDVEDYRFFAKKLIVHKNPLRLNFVVESSIGSNVQLPQELMEYVKNENDQQNVQLKVAYHKPIEGVMNLESTFSDLFLVFWKDGQIIKDYSMTSRGYLLLTNTYEKGRLVSADAYDHGKVFKSVKFVNGQGEYKLYSPQGILMYKESYKLDQDSIEATEYESNGSVKYTKKYDLSELYSILSSDKRSWFMR